MVRVIYSVVSVFNIRLQYTMLTQKLCWFKHLMISILSFKSILLIWSLFNCFNDCIEPVPRDLSRVVYEYNRYILYNSTIKERISVMYITHKLHERAYCKIYTICFPLNLWVSWTSNQTMWSNFKSQVIITVYAFSKPWI